MQRGTVTMAAEAPTAPRDVYYFIGREWYKGSEPPFYDAKSLPGTRILREHFPAIKAEIDAFYRERAGELKANFTPYAYREAGWKTLNLHSYFLKYPEVCARFPVTSRVVESIPGMCLAQIAVLDPHTRIKAHFGDCDALIRSHLGIHVPAGLPDLGIQVGRERRGWEEGGVFAIQIAHRHYAWNRTDEYRIVLVVDVIRPEFAHRRYEIAGKALAAISMKWFATRFPASKRMPMPLVRALHRVLGAGFRARLWAQRRFGV